MILLDDALGHHHVHPNRLLDRLEHLGLHPLVLAVMRLEELRDGECVLTAAPFEFLDFVHTFGCDFREHVIYIVSIYVQITHVAIFSSDSFPRQST
jgi:hypothetical protein